MDHAYADPPKPRVLELHAFAQAEWGQQDRQLTVQTLADQQTHQEQQLPHFERVSHDREGMGKATVLLRRVFVPQAHEWRAFVHDNQDWPGRLRWSYLA